MGKVTCGCLNVKIHHKNSNLQPLDITTLGLSNDSTEEFFNLEISEVQLDLEGVRIEHSYLIKQHKVNDWVIHQCSNCVMFTHATHAKQGVNKVLVNRSLKTDPTIIERLQKSPDFSPVYKIVIRSRNDNNPVKSLGLQSGKYESIQRQLNSIQQQLNRFVHDQQTAMEERIRLYEEQQKEAFVELQSKARNDKNALVGLLLAAEEQELSQSLSEAMTESSLGLFSLPGSSHDELERSNLQTATQKHKTPTRDLTNSNKAKSSKATNRPTIGFVVPKSEDSVDAEGLFDLDGMHEDESRPFYMSDDENEGDTDDSSLNEGYGTRNVPSRSLYSSSVPVSIPAWRMASARQIPLQPDFDDEDDERVSALDPEDMAASIKALARSVHGDGTEMFGDRPRPRLNTLDMGKL